MPPIGVFAVIPNERDEVLLAHRTDFDIWNLPGGGLEEGESPWEGVLREVREETTLAVEVVRLSGVYWKPMGQTELVFTFLCRVVSGTPAPTDEADDLRWFSPDRLLANTSPRHVERIRDALARNAEAVLRVQTGPGARELIDGLDA